MRSVNKMAQKSVETEAAEFLKLVTIKIRYFAGRSQEVIRRYLSEKILNAEPNPKLSINGSARVDDVIVISGSDNAQKVIHFVIREYGEQSKHKSGDPSSLIECFCDGLSIEDAHNVMHIIIDLRKIPDPEDQKKAITKELDRFFDNRKVRHWLGWIGSVLVNKNVKEEKCDFCGQPAASIQELLFPLRVIKMCVCNDPTCLEVAEKKFEQKKSIFGAGTI